MAMSDAVAMLGVSRSVQSWDAAGQAVESVTLLRDITLSVPAGGVLLIAGPSGSGKSTLIRLINRLDDATAGTVTILGRGVTDWPVRELRRKAAFVFQEPSLGQETVRENLRLPFVLSREMPADIDARIARAMEQAELEPGFLDRGAGQLSVGQKQRVTLARALITEPEILLLDEPTSSLDARTASELLNSLAGIQRDRNARGQSLTVILVTHRLTEARRMGGDLAVLIDGQLASLGPVAQMLDEPPAGPAGEFLRGGEL